MSGKSVVLQRKLFHKDTMIFTEGDAGHYAYLIQSGEVSIIKHTVNGMMTLAKLEKNAIFGEMAVIDRGRRMASAIANSETTCILINNDQLDAKLATLTPPERAGFRTMMDYVRRTLPWEQRKKIAGHEKVSDADIAIKEHLIGGGAIPPKTEDRFLLSLHGILLDYVKRRLPVLIPAQ